MWRIRRLTNPSEIGAFLRSERLYAAYALGNLDAEPFEQSEWFGAEVDGVLHTVVLVYRGATPPSLFVLGDADGLALLLGTALREPRINYIVAEPHVTALRTFYRMFEPAPMWRMAVRASTFKAVASDRVRRLYPGDARQLESLYAQAGAVPGEEPLGFAPAQLNAGVYYGIRAKGSLVSAAGTYVVSTTRKIAVVGNVFTQAAQRGQGYATACTSAVTAELLAMGIVDVVLSAPQGDQAAVGMYERLGYTCVCPLYEGLGVRKGWHGGDAERFGPARA